MTVDLPSSPLKLFLFSSDSNQQTCSQIGPKMLELQPSFASVAIQNDQIRLAQAFLKSKYENGGCVPPG
jgi:hypothetical protein